MKKFRLESIIPVLLTVLVVSTLVYFAGTDVLPSAKALSEEELRQEYATISTSPMTGSCGGLNHPVDEYMKGACCGKMRLERYVKQRQFLEKFDEYDIISKDPWNVPVEQAQKLTQFDKNTILSAEEQKVYDEALEIFDEGPCCCKCWRWFAFNGLAKHLIQEEGFSAQEIAEMWASEDVCGDEDPYEELGESEEY